MLTGRSERFFFFVGSARSPPSPGFPRQLLVSLAEALLTEVQGRRTREEREPNRNVAVVLYVHGVSHRVKKAAGRAGVRVVFSAPFLLGGMCRRVNEREGSRASCSKRHAKPFTECATCVVCEIPCLCGSVYVKQTGSLLESGRRQRRRLPV
ncbi:hypothetical protein HPB52_023059 [Rhipicephalus sanguineus]|uniref:Uncharacterized protein n=1 Tax=Rhipicephalus sanguineus TaxID=34632 RepID=A0A9D4SR83_RHISA|nr:hypothetical protein HPB52_023059 [Rhipicephalus sanguineus]